MRNYSTQMEAARKGIITPELEIVAKKERMTTEELLPLVASGKVVICANKNHKCIDPEGVGSMLRTKINVNLGVSRDCKDYDVEMQKKLPYYGGTYEACNIPFTDFQIRYQPEQIRIVDGKRILEDTAFLCRKDNDHFLILPSVYEKLDLDDWLLAHLFFYDKDGKRYIGVELSEVD